MKNDNSPLHFPIDTLNNEDVALCHNLRPLGKGFEAIGAVWPLDLSLFPGAKIVPGGIHKVERDTYIFLEYQGRFVCTDRYNFQILPPVPGTPCAMMSRGEDLIVMMGEGYEPMLLTLEKGRWSWSGLADFSPLFTIVSKPGDLVSSRIGGIKLSGEYSSRSTDLLPADVEAVSKALVKTYCQIGDSVAMRGCYFQPVMARYRVRGHDGRILYVSPPELIVPESGWQLTSRTLTLSGDGFSQLDPETIWARSFRLDLEPLVDMNSGKWRRIVKCTELFVTPQLHPLDESFSAECAFGAFTAVAGKLHVSLPGASDTNVLFRRRAEALLAHVDEAIEPVATATYDPSSSLWRLSDPATSAFQNTLSEIASLRKLLKRPVAVADEKATTIAALSMPHCISAGVVGEGGDCVALGSLSARRFGGWLPGEFAIEASAGPDDPATPMACRVTFADGSSSVRSFVAPHFTLSTLSPLLLYPSADAVKLELFCGDSSLSVDLAPDPSGRFAYSLSAGGLPRVMQRDRPAFILPAANPAPRLFPGVVAVSRASDPLAPTAVASVGESRMTALCAATTPTGGWDAGSARFYLFGHGGIHALTVNTARRVLTARILDRRPVESHDAVCPIGHGGIAVAAGEDILCLSGQRVSVLRSFVGSHRLGWNPAKGELLCFHSPEHPCPANLSLMSGQQLTPLSPEVTVIRPSDGALFTRSAPLATSVGSGSGGLWATDSEGHIYDLCEEQPDAMTEVHYRSRCPAGSRAPSRRLLPLPVCGTVGEGYVELRGDNGCGESRSDCIASFALQGDFVHLPPAPVFTPHCHNFILNLSLKVRKSNFLLAYAS